MYNIGENVGSSKEQLSEHRACLRDSWKGTAGLGALCEKLPLYASFNDSSRNAHSTLRSEEKGLEGDASRRKSSSRKSSSRSKTSKDAGAATMPVKSFAEFFPVTLLRKPTRHFYTKVELGANAEMFILDTRTNSLGKLQIKWLCGALENSMSTWKIVSCVPSAGYKRTVDQNCEEIPFEDEEEKLEQEEAATKLQARARGMKLRKEAAAKKEGGAGGGGGGGGGGGQRNIVFGQHCQNH